MCRSYTLEYLLTFVNIVQFTVLFASLSLYIYIELCRAPAVFGHALENIHAFVLKRFLSCMLCRGGNCCFYSSLIRRTKSYSHDYVNYGNKNAI